MKTTSETVTCEHTPTPYAQFAGTQIWASGVLVATANTPQSAHFIVKACNAHDVLLDACKDFYVWLQAPALDGKTLAEMQEKARHAISQATNT